MQHWWKWGMALTIAAGLPLLVVSTRTAQAGAPAPVNMKVAGYQASTGSRAAWPQWTNVGTKLVPILSLGTPGIRLGLAQVSGPSRLVSRVRAVMQLDADFNGVRAKIMVPSDSMTDLRRVQGTAVTAVAQYELMSFEKKAKPQPVVSQRSSANRQSGESCRHEKKAKHKKASCTHRHHGHR